MSKINMKIAEELLTPESVRFLIQEERERIIENKYLEIEILDVKSTIVSLYNAFEKCKKATMKERNSDDPLYTIQISDYKMKVKWNKYVSDSFANAESFNYDSKLFIMKLKKEIAKVTDKDKEWEFKDKKELKDKLIPVLNEIIDELCEKHQIEKELLLYFFTHLSIDKIANINIEEIDKPIKEIEEKKEGTSLDIGVIIVLVVFILFVITAFVKEMGAM